MTRTFSGFDLFLVKNRNGSDLIERCQVHAKFHASRLVYFVVNKCASRFHDQLDRMIRSVIHITYTSKIYGQY